MPSMAFFFLLYIFSLTPILVCWVRACVERVQNNDAAAQNRKTVARWELCWRRLGGELKKEGSARVMSHSQWEITFFGIVHTDEIKSSWCDFKREINLFLYLTFWGPSWGLLSNCQIIISTKTTQATACKRLGRILSFMLKTIQCGFQFRNPHRALVCLRCALLDAARVLRVACDK